MLTKVNVVGGSGFRRPTLNGQNYSNVCRTVFCISRLTYRNPLILRGRKDIICQSFLHTQQLMRGLKDEDEEVKGTFPFSILNPDS